MGQMRSGTKVYSESFKRKVVDQISSGQLTVAEAIRFYDIRGKYSLIKKWFKRFGIPYEFVYTHTTETEFMPDKKPKSIQKMSSKKQVTEARIKELEAALERSELEAAFYKKVIEVAERELKIPILKKSNTKQSKK